MRRCCGRFWRKCKPSRFAVSENQPYGRRPVGSPRDGLCPGIGSWGRNLAHECRWEVKCPCASPDFGIRHRIRVGRRALEFIWIRKPLNCVKPTDYRVGVEKWGLGSRLPTCLLRRPPGVCGTTLGGLCGHRSGAASNYRNSGGLQQKGWRRAKRRSLEKLRDHVLSRRQT